MNWKRIAKAMLAPPLAVMLLLLLIAATLLIYFMAFGETASILAYAAYVLGAYTLTVWCLQMPQLMRRWRIFKNENPFARRWREDAQLRINASLYGALAWNVAYAALQLGLGLYHASFWFYAMALYYTCLALMRFYLVRYTAKCTAREHMRAELLRYRVCGWVFLLMNLALTVMIFLMVRRGRTFYHDEITAIAMATYTFTAFTVAIVELLRYRKYQSPAYTAAKIVSLAAACVSMLTLEATMLTTFSNPSADAQLRRALLGASGGVISLWIIAMAIYMIATGNRKLKQSKAGVATNGE